MTTQKKGKANPILIVLLVVFLLLDTGFGVLIVKTISGQHQDPVPNPDPDPVPNPNPVPNPITISVPDIDDELTDLASRASDAEQLVNNQEYGDAMDALYQILNDCLTLAADNNAYDQVSDFADSVFGLYYTAVADQVQIWEDQSPNAALYEQISSTLAGAGDFANTLIDGGLSIDTTALDANRNELYDRYKEKYILVFNDLRTGDEWSRTTAWQYMQDAASAGLVDQNAPDDPLTLRYRYALAWITQREVTEGIRNGDMTIEDAVSYILSMAENADYNPVLMRDLGSYLDSVGYSYEAQIVKDACVDVWNYMAYTENLYINPTDMYIPGKTSTNATSTIALDDFWYFNDFGKYSISSTNGVTPEGRQYIREVYANALASI